MKIQRTINAVIGTVYDRRTITTVAKGKGDSIDKNIAVRLSEISGPSVHMYSAPKRTLISWYKAYQNNLKKQKWIEEINKPFEKPSTMKKIFHRITNK